jgi:diadenosine tetraphosphate (Ap4A) HIT family hydrolase
MTKRTQRTREAQRVPFDAEHYAAELKRANAAGECFICDLVAGRPEHHHEVIFRDGKAIAFLNRYPSTYGHTLVAPLEHREHVTGDFQPEEYVALQRVVHAVGEAVRATVPTERLYLLSLGSQQGNRHVHWHVVPLPPGVPYEHQQLEALRLEATGVLALSEEEERDLAQRLRDRLAHREEPNHR